jgi:hypothetical protein
VDADPSFVSDNLIKVDLANDFYRVLSGLYDVPKLGVAFPPLDPEEALAAIPLVNPGHCFVPQSYSENAKLSKWVATQRKQNRLQIKGKKESRMTLPRIQAVPLESFGSFDMMICYGPVL